MPWVERSFADLTTAELYEILWLRQRVFILEQACFYPDIDGLDDRCVHLWTRGARAHAAAESSGSLRVEGAPREDAPSADDDVPGASAGGSGGSGGAGDGAPAPISAYLRILPPGLAYPEPSLGRVIVDPSTRGTGLGLELMRQGMRRAWHHFGPRPIRIGAQAYLERFYASLGFARASADYVADGIAHLEMLAAPPPP